MKRALVMPRRTALAFAGMLLLVAVAGFADVGLALTLAPALLLLGLFACGVRPGETLIERLIERRAPAPARAVSAPRPRLVLIVRLAGRLLASGLATRPPPSAPAFTS